MSRDYYQDERLRLKSAMDQSARVGGPKGRAPAASDPDVERILEGFAFLVARLRRRMDDGIDDLAMRLGEVLAPSMAFATPAATMVLFRRQGGPVDANPAPIEPGSTLMTAARDLPKCEFRTAGRSWLLPAQVTSATVAIEASGRATLRVGLTVADGAHGAVFHPNRPLRLYLHGEQAYAIHHHLLRRCRAIRVAVGNGRPVELSVAPFDPLRREPLSGKQFSITAVGFAPEDSLFPASTLVAPGLRLMQEFAVLPQKFLSVDVWGLAAALPPTSGGAPLVPHVDLTFQFADGVGLLPRGDQPGSVLLNVAPVVNLFRRRAHPIDLLPGRSEYDLWPESHERSVLIRRVMEVSLFRGRGLGTVRVPPLHSFEHSTRGASDNAGFFVARSGGDQPWSITHRPIGGEPTPGASLSVELECCNGDEPPALGDSVSFEPIYDMDNDLQAESLFRTSWQLPPVASGDASWQTLAHLAASRRGLGDSASLNALLELCFRAAREKHARCGGADVPTVNVRSVVARRDGVGLVRGVPVPRTTVQVTIDEGSLRSPGEASIFAAILAELHSAYLSPNAFLRLELFLGEGGRRIVWCRANGRLWVPRDERLAGGAA